MKRTGPRLLTVVLQPVSMRIAVTHTVGFDKRLTPEHSLGLTLLCTYHSEVIITMATGKRKRDYAREYERRIAKAKERGQRLGLEGKSLETYAKGQGRGFHPTDPSTARTPAQYEKTQAVRQELNELIDAAVANANSEGRKVKRTELRKEISHLLAIRNEYIRAWVKFKDKAGMNITAKHLAELRQEFDHKYADSRKAAMQAKLELSAITGSNRESNFKIWRDTP